MKLYKKFGEHSCSKSIISYRPRAKYYLRYIYGGMGSCH